MPIQAQLITTLFCAYTFNSKKKMKKRMCPLEYVDHIDCPGLVHLLKTNALAYVRFYHLEHLQQPFTYISTLNIHICSILSLVTPQIPYLQQLLHISPLNICIHSIILLENSINYFLSLSLRFTPLSQR